MNVDDDKTRLEMSEIQYILINKYSIVFLPKSKTSKIIAIDIDYKKEILNVIEDKTFIVDNSNLYGG